MSQWGKPFRGETTIEGVAYHYLAVPHFDSAPFCEPRPGSRPEVVLVDECQPEPPTEDVLLAIRRAATETSPPY